jgi:hypothetical protein
MKETTKEWISAEMQWKLSQQTDSLSDEMIRQHNTMLEGLDSAVNHITEYMYALAAQDAKKHPLRIMRIRSCKRNVNY